MKKSSKNRRRLILCMMSILLCLVLLIGTTFAWFTDSATAGVNNIEAGTLDLVLEKYVGGSWVPVADGSAPLGFVKAAAGAGEELLWEPGCTYELPKLRVRNAGKLSFKFRVDLSELTGDTALAKVLEVFIGGAPTGMTLENAMTANDADGIMHGVLLPGEFTADDAGAISLHMKETAGNEYQGLSVSGIAITVRAAQYTHEFDSYTDQYDAAADFGEIASQLSGNVGTGADGSTTFTKGGAVESARMAAPAAGGVPTIVEGTAAGGAAANNIPMTGSDPTVSTDLSITVTPGERGATGIVYDISAKATVTETPASGSPVTTVYDVTKLSEYVTIDINLGKLLDNVAVTHSGVPMAELPAPASSYTAYYASYDTGSGIFSYDYSTGILCIVTKTFSPFSVTYNAQPMQVLDNGLLISGDGTTVIDGSGYTKTTLDTEDLGPLVTRIEADAFRGAALTSISIKDAPIVYIGARAFANCTSLSSVVLSDTLVEAEHMFSSDSAPSFTTIDLSNTQLTTIYPYFFYGNNKLVSVTLPNGVTSIGDEAFSKCSELTTVNMPTALVSIGKKAFQQTKLTGELVLPSGVTTISDNAFYASTGLTRIVIPEGVTSIGANSIREIPTLETVELPSTLTSIGSQALRGKSGQALTIRFGGTVAQWNAVTKGSSWNLNLNLTVVCTDGNA